jgi:hypothetical protein
MWDLYGGWPHFMGEGGEGSLYNMISNVMLFEAFKYFVRVFLPIEIFSFARSCRCSVGVRTVAKHTFQFSTTSTAGNVIWALSRYADLTHAAFSANSGHRMFHIFLEGIKNGDPSQEL